MSSLTIVKTIEQLNQFNHCQHNNKIGLVATMGNLHDGHLRLIDHLQSITDTIIVSIFVNPTQFAPNEDYQSYPRTFEKDLKILENTACDTIFIRRWRLFIHHKTQ